MSSKSRQSEDGSARPVPDEHRGFSITGIAVTFALVLAVAGLWVVTASSEPNEWFFFDRYSNSVFMFNLTCTYLTLVCGYVLLRTGKLRERAFNAVLHLGRNIRNSRHDRVAGGHRIVSTIARFSCRR